MRQHKNMILSKELNDRTVKELEAFLSKYQGKEVEGVALRIVDEPDPIFSFQIGTTKAEGGEGTQ